MRTLHYDAAEIVVEADGNRIEVVHSTPFYGSDDGSGPEPEVYVLIIDEWFRCEGTYPDGAPKFKLVDGEEVDEFIRRGIEQFRRNFLRGLFE